jgi:hypothetical protein
VRVPSPHISVTPGPTHATCSKCNLGASFAVAPLPTGTAFTKPTVPAALNIGANHIVVTSDGKHNIFVGTMWAAGVWRYVEP